MNTLCGNCPTVVKAGEPMLEISMPGWCKVRCEGCADEPVPAVIEDLPTAARTIGPRFAKRIEAIRGVAEDFKVAQGGER